MGNNKSSHECAIEKIVRFTDRDGEEKLFAHLKPKGQKAFDAFVVRKPDNNTFEFQKQTNEQEWTPFTIRDSESLKKLDEACKTELGEINHIENIKVKKLVTVTNLYDEWRAEKELLEHTVFEGKAVDSVFKKDDGKITWLGKKIQFTVKPPKEYYKSAAENVYDGEAEPQTESADSEKQPQKWVIKFSYNKSKPDVIGTLFDAEDQKNIIDTLRKACNDINPGRVMARSLGTDNSEFKLVKFSGYNRKPDDKKAIVYSVENGCIMTGLYCGVINFSDENPPLEIRTEYSDTLVMRMINRCCGIYASESPKSNSSVNSDSIYSKIVQYLYMLSLGKVIKLLVPQRYKYIKDRGYNIRGNIDINAYVNHDIIAKDKKVSFVYPERREIQPIIDVLYAALKCCRLSVNSTLPELGGYESYLGSIYSGRRPSRKMIKDIQKEKCLKTGLFSVFKRPLELASVLLENEDLNMFGEDSSSGINGLLMDSSFLWEQYLEDLMVRYLDNWSVDSQSEIDYYRKAFYHKTNRPDFILTNNQTGQIFILDAKFKRMIFRGSDVDNDDIQQVHCYSYYYLLRYGSKFRGTALVYPSRIDQKKEEDLSKKAFYAKMFGTEYASEVETMAFFDQKFGILTLKDVVIPEGDNTYEPDSSIDLSGRGSSFEETEILDMNEEGFIKRLKDFLEESNTAEQD